MTFLSPALFGVLIPLAALPLVLHLLNKGFPRRFHFPSIELIKETMARRSKIHTWRHWILLLLRTAFLLLLLVAFLRPVLRRFSSNPADQTGRDVVIVLDHSASMEHKGDGPASRERAVHEAAKLIDSLGPQDSINILLMDPALTTSFVAFSRNSGEAKQFLHQIKPGLGRADVNLASAAAARLAAGASRPEVYYISDFSRKKWANANFKMLPAQAKLFFVDVGPAKRDNRVILNAQPSQAQILAGDTIPLEVSVGNFGHAPFDGRVTVTVDKKFSFDREVSMAPWSEEKLTVPISVGGPGAHLCEVALPPDALELDNHFFLSLSVLDKEEVLIATDAPDNLKSGAYFLKTALNPFEDKAGSLLPKIIPSRGVTTARLAGVQKLFFTQVNRLTPQICEAAAQFLVRGGGLVYFLDGPADPENFVSLEKVIGANSMPLRLARRNVATNVTSGAQQIVRGSFKSPYLKLFQGNTRQDLALLEFYDYYQAGNTAAGEVLLEFGDGSPAMAALHHGLGTLLFLNFSVGELSSNLARQRIFPAWMQDLVKALSTAEPPVSSHAIGESIHAEIWRNEIRYDLLSPDGTSITSKRELNGERCTMDFTPTQLGFYTLGKPSPLYTFAVNVGTDQSDLRPIDKSILPTEFADNRDAHLISGADSYDELARGHPIFHWFVFAALAFLALEGAFQFLVRRKPA